MKLAKLGAGPEIFHTIQGEGVSAVSRSEFEKRTEERHPCFTTMNFSFEFPRRLILLTCLLLAISPVRLAAQSGDGGAEEAPPLTMLVEELQAASDLMPWCPEFFARKWATGSNRAVEASSALQMDGRFLVLVRKADGVRMKLDLALMPRQNKIDLHRFASYAKVCARAREQLVAANGGSKHLEWTGADGVTRSGEVLHVLVQPAGATGVSPAALALVAAPRGNKQPAKVSWERFSAKSQQFLLGMLAKIPPSVETATGPAPSALPAAPRNQIPAFNQSDFKGGQSENCGPNSVANFIVWWDRTQLLPLPLSKKRDERERAEWVHERLFGLMRSGGGTSLQAMCEGVKGFFARYYEGKAQPRFDVFGLRNSYIQGFLSQPKAKPFTIAAAAEACTGHKAAVLTISQLKGGRPKGGHYVSLLTTEPDGKVLIATWGKQFRGTLKQLDATAIAKLPARWQYGSTSPDYPAAFEIILSNATQWMTEQDCRWFILPEDGLLTIEPVLTEP